MSVGGLSKARLRRMHDVMAGHVERGDVPGLVTLISRQGEVHVDAIGAKTLGGSDPMRRDTIFRIASMTKPITAAAAMILVEECKLRLDEPVDRLLPELANRKVLKRIDGPLDDTVPAKRPITLRDLLTFRMGFGSVMAPPGTYPIQKAMSDLQIGGDGPPNPSKTPAPDEWIRRLGTLPLMHQPGEKWMYNTGSDVLGVLIVRVSGQPFATFLRERIFEPLGMKDTDFSVPSGKLDRLPGCYSGNPKTGALEIYDDARASQWSRPPAFPSAAGGLVSTVDDYLAFCQMMLSTRAHPVAAFGRAHDQRPADASAEGGGGDLLRRPQQLGVRGRSHHAARRSGGGSETVRLERWPGHLRLFGSQGRNDRDPHDPAPDGFSGTSARVCRFLDIGVSGDRRLNHCFAGATHSHAALQ
jgi:CubicO group peptidase (beta-lactamase class C family)